MDQEEIWKDVVGWEGKYQVSSIGRVKRLTHIITYKNGVDHLIEELILVNAVDKDGYKWIGLCKDQKKFGYRIHRLVIQAFIGGLTSDMQVNHINGIKNDNRLENLEMCTASENVKHAYHVLGKKMSGIAKDSEVPVTAYFINNRNNRYHRFEILGVFKSFKSINDAARSLGIPNSNISVAIKNNTTAGGYHWTKNEREKAC